MHISFFLVILVVIFRCLLVLSQVVLFFLEDHLLTAIGVRFMDNFVLDGSHSSHIALIFSTV